MKMSRRQFATGTAATAASAALLAGSAGQVLGANERVRLGFIGLGNRGDQVLEAFLVQPDCQVAAVCDLWQPYLDLAASKIEKAGKSAAMLTMHRNYRELLDRKDIDAVVICTPDHWHALQTIHACRAGKDVYVEKPLGLTVAEGRAMVTAARAAKRIVQVGLHRRSSSFVREAAQLVREGAIGAVTAVRAWHVQNETPLGIGRPADGPIPEGLDWDAWCGPAPLRPFNINRCFYRFRWFYDYSGGQLTNIGVHYLDVIHWALGRDVPSAVTAIGGKFADFDNREIPDTLEVLWRYPAAGPAKADTAGGASSPVHAPARGDVLVSFAQINANGAPPGVNKAEIEFRGTTGTMFVQSRGYEIVPEVPAAREFPVLSPTDRTAGRGWRDGKPTITARKGSGDQDTRHHARNFLDCIKSRQAPNCDVEVGHRSTTAAQIGNIALRTERLLHWDGIAERFLNSPDADRLLTYDYRAPYTLEG